MSTLPPDNHVHTEWSWDAKNGSMERTCARAVELGLPAVAFTDHADYTRFAVPPGSAFEEPHGHLMAPDRTLLPPPIDVDGYLECVERCRGLFPDLRILTGVELGEAHRHPDAAAALLAAGRFDRVLGSMHSVVIGPDFYEMPDAYGQLPSAQVMREYLAEVHRLVTSSDVFSVLAHIDYAVRYWPAGEKPFDPWAFQDEFRHVLRALAASGRALEVNTRLPLDADIVRWWRDEGGDAVTFGSDAHQPDALANGFAAAAAMVQALGFRPGRHAYELWGRA